MKKPSTAVQVGSLNQTNDERIEKERNICKERRNSPYRQVDHAIKAATIQRSDEQVTSTIKTNIAVIQWNADVVYTRVRTIVSMTTMLERKNIHSNFIIVSLLEISPYAVQFNTTFHICLMFVTQ